MTDRIAAALERIATALEATAGDDDLDMLVDALSSGSTPTVPHDVPQGPTREMGGIKRFDLGEGWWIVQYGPQDLALQAPSLERESLNEVVSRLMEQTVVR